MTVQALAALPAGPRGGAAGVRAPGGGVVALVLGVVALHALVLLGWPEVTAVAPRAGQGRAAVMQVRLAPLPLKSPPGAEPARADPAVSGQAQAAPWAAPGRVARAVAGADPRPSPLPQAAEGASQNAPGPAAASGASPPTPKPNPTPITAAAAAAAPTTTSAAEPADAETPAPPTAAFDPAALALPTYATRLPPPVVLTYEAHRPGTQRSGAVQLAWQPQGDHYALSLGSPQLGSTSTGVLDAHGVAPERQADTRRAREVRAVNFQRDAGRITYSGPQVEHPLLPGAQDRLSWLVQLAGILAADATLSAPGSTVRLFVTGPRGDAAVWTFTVIGPDAVLLPGGAQVPALRLLREPEGPHDTRVELWADPTRHHLPVRLRLQPRGAAATTEFLLAAPTP